MVDLGQFLNCLSYLQKDSKKIIMKILSNIGLGPMSTEIIDIISDFALENKKYYAYFIKKSN